MRRRIETGLVALAAAGMAGALAGVPAPDADPDGPGALHRKLSETGLFAPGTTEIAADKLPYSPQYPLWSDGTVKRRWLYLPPEESIDASDPEAWQFPPGTRLWKEFSYDRAVETRLIERLADGSWRFATYVWDEDGRDATLAPADGIAGLPVAAAPGGRYPIPPRDDCLACHEAAAVPVLGVGALQLSPDRDALAPHAEKAQAEYVDLRILQERGLLRNLPEQFLGTPPRIDAPSPSARAALGYLHGNCGHCHNDTGPLAAVDLSLLQLAAASGESLVRALETLIDYPSDPLPEGADTRVVPGAHQSSALLARMRSRDPMIQMPPLGTRIIDAEAIALVTQWIQHDLQTREKTKDESL